jgi:flagellar export protein FliJ
MAKGTFSFRFETLLRLRKQREDERKRVVASRLRQIGEVRRRHDELLAALDEQTRTLRASLRDSSIDVDQLRWGRHWLSHLRRGILEADAEILAHRAMLAQERSLLIGARKEREVLARLKEQRRQAFLFESARREQMEADELVADRYARAILMESALTERDGERRQGGSVIA